MRMIDLFSGIGGFHLAAEWVWGSNLDVLCHCEIEPFPQKILLKHWPGVQIISDIKDLNGKQFSNVDILTGGFPCQPFSQAGKQGGSKDDRHLWPEMFRVIQETRPRWVVGENVNQLKNFVEFENLLIDLEKENYEVQPIIIPACGKDAPHRRNRIWIIANNEGELNGENIAKESKRQIQQSGKCIEQTNVSNPNGHGEKRDKPPNGKRGRIEPCGEILADTKGQRGRGRHSEECRTEERKFQQEKQAGSTVRSETPGCRVTASNSNSPRLQAGAAREKPNEQEFTTREDAERGGIWQPEPSVGRVAHGIPSRVDRLKGLGNAIVPQVAAEIFYMIKQIDEMEDSPDANKEA